MARKRSKNQQASSQATKLAIIPRMPRFNIKGSISDQTVLSGNRRITHTVAAGNGHATIPLDINAGRTLDPIADVGLLYRQYKYLPGTSYVHVPSVSLTSAGTVAVAYIDNPEQIANWIAITGDANRYDFVTAIGNHKAYPIWKEFTFPVTAPPRRLTYDVNAVQPTANLLTVDDIERSWQGAVILSFAGVTPDAGTVSRAYLHQRIMLRGLCGQQVG